MDPKCFQVPNTRAFILRIRGVLLCLSQDLGEGQLHVLVHCLQQEVPAPQLKARQREGCQEETMTYPPPSVLQRSHCPHSQDMGRPTPKHTSGEATSRLMVEAWQGCLPHWSPHKMQPSGAEGFRMPKGSQMCVKGIQKSAWIVSTLFTGRMPAVAKHEASRTLTWC